MYLIQYHVEHLRLTIASTWYHRAMPIIQLWKDQLSHFGALVMVALVTVPTHSCQCAIEMETGHLILLISVPLNYQVLILTNLTTIMECKP